ncbi:OadG family protein [Lignipirellula cremea]|uniref:Oxaloacetate decarboxylase, gamma chain n=1 Tax=Lignipirellula cremea TaxID=2528010 RepID=A0A518DWS6_9BACT|nr:OadG family protein [Lignipirellula cremea]QDU96289.1 hypothetical protein Pla8534_41090 [Lignipirellula cremea]
MSPLLIIVALAGQTPQATTAESRTIGLHNITSGDPSGWGLALTGMFIVFIALASITLAIAALPRVLNFLEPYLPEESSHGHSAPASPIAKLAAMPADGTAAGNEEAIVAALGYVMHTRKQSP